MRLCAGKEDDDVLSSSVAPLRMAPHAERRDVGTRSMYKQTKRRDRLERKESKETLEKREIEKRELLGWDGGSRKNRCVRDSPRGYVEQCEGAVESVGRVAKRGKGTRLAKRAVECGKRSAQTTPEQ